jgi:cell division protein ZapA
MPNVPIVIDGRQYNLSCDKGQEEKLSFLAKSMDKKAGEIRRACPQITENLLLVMVGILEAEEAYNLRNGNGTASQNSPDYLQQEEKANQLAARIDELAKSL